MAKQSLSEHHHPREDHPVENRRLRRHYTRTQHKSVAHFGQTLRFHFLLQAAHRWRVGWLTSLVNGGLAVFQHAATVCSRRHRIDPRAGARLPHLQKAQRVGWAFG